MDLSAYEATGSNNPNRQISVTKWNNLLSALEAADAAKAQHAADRTALAALATANPIAYLREAGREGIFKWDASDLSAEVTADTAQGVYVPPTGQTGSAGAWVRRFDGPINPEWFGIVEGDNAANGAGNATAWAALVSCLAALQVNTAATYYRGLYDVLFGLGIYHFNATLDLTSGAIRIKGRGNGHGSSTDSAAQTVLKFTDCTGVRIQYIDTSGASTKDGASHVSGVKSLIENIALEGSFAGTEAEYHGLHLRAGATAFNVSVRNFAGDGIRIEADTGALGGNANVSTIINCNSAGNRNGIRTTGNNANACIIIGGSFDANREWGIKEGSTLGNTYSGCEIGTNGQSSYNDGVTIGASVVSSGGNRYGAIAGQESGASTNAPTGAATDNTWWYYISAGGPATGIPAWSSGMVVRAGGCARDEAITSRSVFSGCYAEAGPQGKAQIWARSVVIGGFLSTWIFQNSAANTGTAVIRPDDHGVLALSPVVEVGSGNTTAKLGWNQGNTSDVILSGSHATASPNGNQLMFDTSGGDIIGTYSRGTAIGNYAFRWTGTATTQQFGTGAAVPHSLYVPRLYIGNSAGNGRQMTNGTAAPASGAHARGEVVWNMNMAAGSAFGWFCTAAGTPGTWAGAYALASLTVTSSGLTMNTAKLLGRTTASAGAVEEIGLDTDTTLAANSDTVVATQKAVKAYVDKHSPYVLGQSGAQSPHTGDTNETALATITVPANALGANGRIEVWAHFSMTGTNSKTLRGRLGGVAGTSFSSASYTTQTAAEMCFYIANANATNSQQGQTFSTGAAALVTGAVDTTANADLVLTGALTNTGESVTLENYRILIFPSA